MVKMKEASASFLFTLKCNQFGYKIVSLFMRVIAVKTLKDWCDSYPKARQSLLAWYEEAISADWNSPNELKSQFRSASIISNKKVIFNIQGNSFRLIVDIEYRLKLVFIVWFGTHQEYDRIDSKLITYVKANKK